MNELALFAGAGGGILGGHLLGGRTVCAVEWEPYAASVLAARQNDGLLPPFPIWDDVCTFDGKPWRGRVDVVSGGFPCQDISVAGKGAGITGKRSGMWTHMARIVGEVRPRFVFVENSPALLTRGLGVVLGDLAALGYDCRWTVLGAADVGAPHQRDRFWLVAHADVPERRPLGGACDGLAQRANGLHGIGQEGAGGSGAGGEALAYASDKLRREIRRSLGEGKAAGEGALPGWKVCKRHWRTWDDGFAESGSDMADPASVHAQRRDSGSREIQSWGSCWWITEPNVGRVADGVAARVDRLRAIGNGQVPACAATAWRMLMEAA